MVEEVELEVIRFWCWFFGERCGEGRALGGL